MTAERVWAWAQEHSTRPIRAIQAIAGGLTDTISAVRFDTGDPLILRHASVARWGETGRRHIAREAIGTRLLRGSGLPIPELVASDPDGSQTGAYVNLTTWRPGQVRLDRLNPVAMDELARVAVRIHALPVAAVERPPAYGFGTPTPLTVPAWSRHPRSWQRAIDIFAAGPPTTPSGLVHRDFHPGNLLWLGNQITGVIDWAETSWGPPDLDVVHSATNFALLHDPEAAEDFVAAYRRHGGQLTADPDAARFWGVLDLLGFLPNPAAIVAAIVVGRPDLTATVVQDRLEHLLVTTLTG